MASLTFRHWVSEIFPMVQMGTMRWSAARFFESSKMDSESLRSTVNCSSRRMRAKKSATLRGSWPSQPQGTMRAAGDKWRTPSVIGGKDNGGRGRIQSRGMDVPQSGTYVPCADEIRESAYGFAGLVAGAVSVAGSAREGS